MQPLTNISTVATTLQGIGVEIEVFRADYFGLLKLAASTMAGPARWPLGPAWKVNRSS